MHIECGHLNHLGFKSLEHFWLIVMARWPMPFICVYIYVYLSLTWLKHLSAHCRWQCKLGCQWKINCTPSSQLYFYLYVWNCSDDESTASLVTSPRGGAADRDLQTALAAVEAHLQQLISSSAGTTQLASVDVNLKEVEFSFSVQA